MISKVFNNALLGIIGFILSAYSVYVEHKVEHKDDNPNDEYSALCDIEVCDFNDLVLQILLL